MNIKNIVKIVDLGAIEAEERQITLVITDTYKGDRKGTFLLSDLNHGEIEDIFNLKEFKEWLKSADTNMTMSKYENHNCFDFEKMDWYTE